MNHPKIQTESKDDIMFLKKELESAGQMALAGLVSGESGTSVGLESRLQDRLHSVRL